MQPARRGGPTRAVAAVVALLVGLALLGVWRVVSGSQDLPFDKGATPPSSVQVTKGHSYALAVPGGVPAMIARGMPTRNTGDQQVIVLECTWSPAGDSLTSVRSPLTAQAETVGTKAENDVGQFYAPITGRIRVDCSGWGPMFVPNSDDRAHDWAGEALLLATILLTIGGALALSELRVALERARVRSTVAVGGDDEIE
ncbi:MAG TPA: hypothetical protein VIG48_08495 [Jatrophihabitans sp.]|jgi:hypothetical protein